ncbi:MAG: TlyA family RNA methyltransferase [Deltaproteobacteria bacterium]|nr:TlyA family RNA methyltransferase [Deltaproteobacteria bacterium]
MGKRERLDKLLVERGLVASREEGRSRILAGEVLVNDRPIAKAGSLIAPDALIRLKGKPLLYVSRGGTKLEKALGEFRIEVIDRIVLDVGASTGGFTDCLLTYGARRVYAVDVGYGQLAWKLRKDPRVVVLEKRNIRYLRPEELPEPPELAVIDVSFISLRLVLLPVMRLLAPRGEILALIKPQFEVGKGKVEKGGVVRCHEEHLRVIEEVKEAATVTGLEVMGVTESPLLGPKGNREFFIYLVKGDAAQ